MALTRADSTSPTRRPSCAAVRDVAPGRGRQRGRVDRRRRLRADPDRAHAVNALGPWWLARACDDVGAILVHVSTDYVFGGDRRPSGRAADAAARPVDRVRPGRARNVYGRTKAAGEQLVRETLPRRTSSSGPPGWPARGGGNFVAHDAAGRPRARRRRRRRRPGRLTRRSPRDLAPALRHLAVARRSGHLPPRQRRPGVVVRPRRGDLRRWPASTSTWRRSRRPRSTARRRGPPGRCSTPRHARLERRPALPALARRARPGCWSSSGELAAAARAAVTLRAGDRRRRRGRGRHPRDPRRGARVPRHAGRRACRRSSSSTPGRRDGTAAAVRAAGSRTRASLELANAGFGRGANAGVARDRRPTSWSSPTPTSGSRRARPARSPRRGRAPPTSALVGPAGRLPRRSSAGVGPAPCPTVRTAVGHALLRWVAPRQPVDRPLPRGSTPTRTVARDVGWVSGCALARAPRRRSTRVDGFDPGYPLYLEDVDLAARLGDAGWRVRYDPRTDGRPPGRRLHRADAGGGRCAGTPAASTGSSAVATVAPAAPLVRPPLRVVLGAWVVVTYRRRTHCRPRPQHHRRVTPPRRPTLPDAGPRDRTRHRDRPRGLHRRRRRRHPAAAADRRDAEAAAAVLRRTVPGRRRSRGSRRSGSSACCSSSGPTRRRSRCSPPDAAAARRRRSRRSPNPSRSTPPAGSAARSTASTGTFLVLNGDILTDVDLGPPSRPTAPRPRPRDAGAHPGRGHLDASASACATGRRITAFVEKPAPGTLPGQDAVNAGTYVLEPDALDRFPDGPAVVRARTCSPGSSPPARHVEGFVSDAVWADLGTPERYLAGHRLALDGALRWPSLDAVARPTATACGSPGTPTCADDAHARRPGAGRVRACASAPAHGSARTSCSVPARSSGRTRGCATRVLADEVVVGDGVEARRPARRPRAPRSRAAPSSAARSCSARVRRSRGRPPGRRCAPPVGPGVTAPAGPARTSARPGTATPRGRTGARHRWRRECGDSRAPC